MRLALLVLVGIQIYIICAVLEQAAAHYDYLQRIYLQGLSRCEETLNRCNQN